MKTIGIAVFAIVLGGCSSTSLNTALGTPKNPSSVFVNPAVAEGQKTSDSAIVVPLYNVLLEASDPESQTLKAESVSDTKMRRYLGAGFALSDIYCVRFFNKTDEAYRRRRFGRTLTNDVGTVMSTVLGLAKAGTNVVTGVAAGVGLADSSWRNYDDAFLISPELSNVQSLVFAAQDNFRARTLGKNVELPADYGTAQSVIQRYANLCSNLGMKALLDQSATKQRSDLNDDTEAAKKGTPVPPPSPAPAPSASRAPRPLGATPAIAPNR